MKLNTKGRVFGAVKNFSEPEHKGRVFGAGGEFQ